MALGEAARGEAAHARRGGGRGGGGRGGGAPAARRRRVAGEEAGEKLARGEAYIVGVITMCLYPSEFPSSACGAMRTISSKIHGELSSGRWIGHFA